MGPLQVLNGSYHGTAVKPVHFLTDSPAICRQVLGQEWSPLKVSHVSTQPVIILTYASIDYEISEGSQAAPGHRPSQAALLRRVATKETQPDHFLPCRTTI